MTRTGRNSLCLVVALVIGGGLAAVSLAVPSEVRGPASADVPAERLNVANTTPNVGGCQVFPADNPWNMRVDGLPLRPGSAATIAKIQSVGGDNLHPDFGENPDYGIPFVVVPASQPLVPISYTEAGDESDPGPFPIPLDAPVEGGAGSSGDRHVIALQQGSCQLFELYSSFPRHAADGGGWEAYSGARFDLNSNALRPLGWTSADAAGLPILPGLVRHDEVAAGAIHHAIRVTFSQTQAAYILPATHEASSRTDTDLPPMGLRLRLRADFDINSLTGQARVIAVALQQYGFIVADNGSNWFFQGAPSPGWDDDDLNQLKDIPGTAFEVVDTGPTQS